MPLNPTLYETLLAIFSDVRIHKQGEHRIVEVVPDYGRPAGRLKAMVLRHGEGYKLNCPFCEDHRRRLMINHSYGVPDPRNKSGNFHLFHCYHGCHKSQDFRERLKDLLRNAGYYKGQIEPGATPEVTSASAPVCLPKNYVPLHLLKSGHRARRYVHQRGFDPHELSIHWGVGYCDEDDSAHPPIEDRIIIPVHALSSTSQPTLVGWQARAIDTDAAGPKYLTNSDLATQNLLYGLPQAIATHGPIVLCEGVTDAWRIGPGALATFGKKPSLSTTQLRLLKNHRTDRPVVVLYDEDASNMARQIARQLNRRGLETTIANLPDGYSDPGEALPEDLWASIGAALGTTSLQQPAKISVLLRPDTQSVAMLHDLQEPIAVEYVADEQNGLGSVAFRSVNDGQTTYLIEKGVLTIECLANHQIHRNALATTCEARHVGLLLNAPCDDMRTMSRLVGEGSVDTEMPSTPLAACSLLESTRNHGQDLRQRVADLGMDFIYREIELPIIPIAAAMMSRGLGVDLELLEHRQKQYASRFDAINQRIASIAGRAVDVGSREQLTSLLFDDLGLPCSDGELTFDKNTLRDLAQHHEIAELIRDCRRNKSLLDNSVQIAANIDPQCQRVCCRIDPLGTDTGRFTTDTPNLHGTPRELREVFIAAEGHVLVEADFSQIELRVLAQFSQDNSLLDAYGEEELDLHRRTAGIIYNTPPERVTNEQRKVGKRVNFAIVYGNTPFGLARDLGITEDAAEEFIDRYLSAHPGVRDWVETTKEAASREGLVRTLYGRLRRLPHLASDNGPERARALRQAVNTVVQGTAADINKLALIRLHQAMPHHWHTLLTVHDSVIVEVPEDDGADAATTIKQILEERPPDFSVNIVADVTVGPRWCKQM